MHADCACAHTLKAAHIYVRVWTTLWLRAHVIESGERKNVCHWNAHCRAMRLSWMRVYSPDVEPQRAKLPEHFERLRVGAERERYVALAALRGLGVRGRARQKLRLAIHVEYDVGRAHRVRDAVDRIARLAMIIALVAVCDIVNVKLLLQLLVELRLLLLHVFVVLFVVELRGRRRPTQRVRVEPAHFGLGISVEQTREVRVAANEHRVAVRRV